MLKCGRSEIQLNDDDKIFFNGVCYSLITRKFWNGSFAGSPSVSKARMKKLIKEGKLVLIEEKLDYICSNGQEMWNRYYKQAKEELK